MTPELEAKGWLEQNFDEPMDGYEFHKFGYTNHQGSTQSIASILESFAASQLSAERKWWIERIEQERDEYTKLIDTVSSKDHQKYYLWLSGRVKGLDDLLASVRERGGK